MTHQEEVRHGASADVRACERDGRLHASMDVGGDLFYNHSDHRFSPQWWAGFGTAWHPVSRGPLLDPPHGFLVIAPLRDSR